MKKTLLTLTLLCVTLTLHALDYRQVIFGNSYENIIEINANSFFAENTEVKKEADFYRVYQQKIGRETFYRVLVMDKNYTDTMLLDWKNVSFTQDLYVKQSGKVRLLIKNTGFYENTDSYFAELTHGGIEIIERNNTVIGIMQFYNGNYTNPLSTLYYRWEDILDGNGIVYTIIHIKDYDTDGETIKRALVDKRRPLMYTIQNAFDGDPATSFVNYGDALIIKKRNVDKDGHVTNRSSSASASELLLISQLEGIMVVNGYASGQYYHQNNQIAQMSIHYGKSGYMSYERYIGPSLYFNDSTKPQVMMFQNDKIDFNTLNIVIEKIVSGTKYNDTALAEIDFYLEGMGWLFGFADEENAIDLSTVNAEDGLHYEFSGENAKIIRYNGNETEITIPSEVTHEGKNYTVTEIGENAFFGRKNLTQIILPNTITKIEASAFAGSGLQSIDIPKGLSVIEESVFSECENLTSVIIPEHIERVGGAFINCYNLDEITFLNKNVDIDEWIIALGSRHDWSVSPGHVTFNVYKNSTAHDFAMQNDIPYVLMD